MAQKQLVNLGVESTTFDRLLFYGISCSDLFNNQ